MTMIDEGRLRDVLREAADSFEISEEAIDGVRTQAQASKNESWLSHVPVLARLPGSARGLLTAAALVLIVGAISLPLLRSEGGPSQSASPAHRSSSGQVVSGTALKTATSLKGLPTTLTLTGSGETPRPGTSSTSAAASLAPKIESTGSVHLMVGQGKVSSALATLGDLAIRDGGFVLSTQATEGTRVTKSFSNGSIVLQVPQHFFASLVAQVQRVGRATSIVTSSNDVTGQYVDFEAQLKALDASRGQYLAIMTRATTIGGILAVQNQLDTIESEMEQLQGQINVLDNETTYGALTVSLAEAGQQSHVVTPRSGLAKAWHDAIAGFVHGFEWLIRISGPALFAVLCLGVLLALGRLVWRATRRRI
jgi:hypothetical protein